MAFSECGNGHIFDTDQYVSCPYCNGGGNQMVFGGVDSGIGKTVPVGAAMGGAPMGGPSFTGAPMGGPSFGGASDIGKTMAPSSYQQSLPSNPGPLNRGRSEAADEGKTVAVMQKSFNTEPVVGWFVCVEGPDKGKDYRILAKNNSIGRGDMNDICIKGDPSIARENQGRLGYDVKHNAFHIIPGESANNIYIGDDPVYLPTKLEPRQIIEIGDTKLMFIPFCDDKFTWEDGIKG